MSNTDSYRQTIAILSDADLAEKRFQEAQQRARLRVKRNAELLRGRMAALRLDIKDQRNEAGRVFRYSH